MLAVVEKLMDKGENLSPDEEKLLKLFARLIEDFEQRYYHPREAAPLEVSRSQRSKGFSTLLQSCDRNLPSHKTISKSRDLFINRPDSAFRSERCGKPGRRFS
jgi:hypothetical protein